MAMQSIRAIFFAALGLLWAPISRASSFRPVAQNSASRAQAGVQEVHASAQQRNDFKAPEVVSASNVQYPLDTTADGIIVLEVSLGTNGEVTNISSLTDIPPLTSVAESSLRTWKFTPSFNGPKTEPSQMLVAFVFRHAVKEWNPPNFNPVFAPREQSGYMPPGIYSATYADYPASTIAASTTVVQLTVKSDGIISNVQAVRSVRGGFLSMAEKAAKSWQFEPAMLKGSPVTSKIAIAFVFSSRALNPF